MGLAKYVIVAFSVFFPIVLSDRDRSQFAENLLQCTYTKHINDCLLQTLEDLRSFMRVGIPELELMPSEPFKMNRLNFKTQSRGAFGVSGVQVESTFTNVSKRCFNSIVIIISIPLNENIKELNIHK